MKSFRSKLIVFLGLVILGFILLTVILALDNKNTSQRSEPELSQTLRPTATEQATQQTPDAETNQSANSPQPQSTSGNTSSATESPSNPDWNTLLAKLAIAPEHTGSTYRRSFFRHWVDEDKDGCDTRREVLISESLTPVKIGAQCTITGGKWYSPYDETTTTNPADLDIDHLVPLAEAWRSGAYAWDASKREAYANDVQHPYALIAVTASENRAKGDKDPASWLPPNSDFACEYVYMWVNVKLQWALTADQQEMNQIRQVANQCRDEPLDSSIAALTMTGLVSLKSSATPTPSPTPSSSCLPNQVDVNTASIEALTRIRHIGEVRAKQLVTLRPFANIDDLIRINGIGPARLADIQAEGIACVN